ncbi:MAG TPA: acyl-CoA thioesterase domain-containing protein [Mycobacteriales bacterium]|nr:acyl-CoA thioesterase domain-containing protein [Mycobacteriales bacterium]
MPLDLANLIARLELRETASGRYDGDNLDLDYRRVFGGQILAQTIEALHRHSDGKSLKSLWQQFPREGDVALPMTYEVTVHQAGRTFATLGVQASQQGKVVSVAAASLHVPEEGLSHPASPPSVPGPEAGKTTVIDMIPWEISVITDADLSSADVHPPHYQWWQRTPDVSSLLADSGSADDTDWLHQALLAHSTDLTVIGTALLPVEGLSQADTGTKFHSAVTSHTMWFHQPFRMDEWLLVDQVSPVLAGSRGFGRGDVWTQDGRLVASFAQESMIRPLAQ